MTARQPRQPRRPRKAAPRKTAPGKALAIPATWMPGDQADMLIISAAAAEARGGLLPFADAAAQQRRFLADIDERLDRWGSNIDAGCDRARRDYYHGEPDQPWQPKPWSWQRHPAVVLSGRVCDPGTFTTESLPGPADTDHPSPGPGSTNGQIPGDAAIDRKWAAVEKAHDEAAGEP